MSKTTYQISLKGYVGGYDFLLRKRQADDDRTTVDRELAKNEGLSALAACFAIIR